MDNLPQKPEALEHQQDREARDLWFSIMYAMEADRDGLQAFLRSKVNEMVFSLPGLLHESCEDFVVWCKFHPCSFYYWKDALAEFQAKEKEGKHV